MELRSGPQQGCVCSLSEASRREASALDPPPLRLPAPLSGHLHFSFRLTAKAVAVLLPILGTSWVFGVLALNSQALVFQYIFAILNSLQVSACGTASWAVS